MTLTSPPLDLLPEPALLIGSERLHKSSGGSHQHIYPGTGETTSPLAPMPSV